MIQNLNFWSLPGCCCSSFSKYSNSFPFIKPIFIQAVELIILRKLTQQQGQNLSNSFSCSSRLMTNPWVDSWKFSHFTVTVILITISLIQSIQNKAEYINRQVTYIPKISTTTIFWCNMHFIHSTLLLSEIMLLATFLAWCINYESSPK